MIPIDIIKQYVGTGLKCHLMGQNEDDYADPTVPKMFTLIGVRQASNEVCKCEFEESENWWHIAEVFPILHPLSDLKKRGSNTMIPGVIQEGGIIFDLKIYERLIALLSEGVDYTVLSVWVYERLMQNHFDIHGLMTVRMR